MADKKVTPVTQASGKEVLIGINNAISIAMGAEDGPAKERLRRLAQYTRAFIEPVRATLLEAELLRPTEAVVILLSCAALVQQSILGAEDRKIPAQIVLDQFFKEEE
jgi:hypothetical protein